MGHIKEPAGVDFIIESKTLTEEERQKISEFIRLDKENNAEKIKTSSHSSESKKKLLTKKPAVNK